MPIFNPVPLTIPLGGTGANSLATAPFAVLSPASQQTGTLNVSGQITASSLSTGSGNTIYGSGTITGTGGSLNIEGNTSGYVRLYIGSSGTNWGVLDMYNSTGAITEIAPENTTVTGVTGSGLNIAIFGGSTLLALDSSGNIGLNGYLASNAGVKVGGALTGATTGAFSGQITSTAGANWLIASGSTTGASWQTIQNTSAKGYFGVESSTGGSIFVGGSAYAVVLGNANSGSLQLATNNTVVQTITSGGATSFTGSVAATGQLSTSTGLTVTGIATATSAIVAGYGYGIGLLAGDLGASRSTSTGLLGFGGSSAQGNLDYGVTTASTFTFSAPLNVTGALESSSKIIAGSGTGSALGTTGDLVASRSTSTGALLLGGGSGVGTLDYGISSTGNFTFSSSVYCNGIATASAGSAPSGFTTGDIAGVHGLSSGRLLLGGPTASGLFDFGYTNAGSFSINQNLVGTGSFSGLYFSSKANGSTSGYTPPAFTSGGAATANTEKIVRGQGTGTTTTGGNYSISISLTGSAQFTSSSSYYVLCTGYTAGGGQTVTVVNISAQTASSFTISGVAGSIASQPVAVNYMAIGY